MFDDEERAELIVKEYGFNFDVIKKKRYYFSCRAGAMQ